MKSMIVNLINQVKEEFSPQALEGKTIRWYNENAPDEYISCEGVIIGCEPGVGITIQHADGSYWSCLNINGNYDYNKTFEEYFWHMVRMLQKGYYDTQESDKFLYGTTKPQGSKMSECAFT